MTEVSLSSVNGRDLDKDKSPLELGFSIEEINTVSMYRRSGMSQNYNFIKVKLQCREKIFVNFICKVVFLFYCYINFYFYQI